MKNQWPYWSKRIRYLARSTFRQYHTLRSKVTEFNMPNFFVDEMVSGIFKSFKHEHHFKDENNGTLMTDTFDYELPMGPLGKLANQLFLLNYMTKLLTERNRVIKEFAKSDQWKTFI